MSPFSQNIKPSDFHPDPALVTRVRQYLIKRYEHRHDQKLAGRYPVNLRLVASSSGTSKERAENYLTLREEIFTTVEVDEVQTVIGHIFNAANRRLLLVGVPGSGKTTLVLQLALNLLKHPGNSISVMLNLATWRAEFKTFDIWLQKILPVELGASQALADQILRNISLVLLLDGLDEVPEVDRDSCLTAIGEFASDGKQQFLISSRIAEYAATRDAPVDAQIEIGQLTVEQIEDRLLGNTQPGSRDLYKALKNDLLLHQAIENPFYLNTAQLLFASGKSWSEFGFTAMNVSGRQQELVERFVEGALAKKAEKDYTVNKAQHWLSFLASRMTSRNMVVFELRDLQYDWWKWRKRQILLANILFGLVFGPISGLVFGLVFGPFLRLGSGMFSGITFGLVGGLVSCITFGLLGGLVSGLFFGLVSGLGGKQVRRLVVRRGDTPIGPLPNILTKDSIDWSWKSIIFHIRTNLFFGLLFTLLFTLLFGLPHGLLIGLVLWLSVGIEDLMKNSTNIIQISTPYQRFNASNRALHFSILQHKHLCHQLRKQGLLPPDLVKFLDEMSHRHILETDGATWRFRHRILQDYFAGLWVEPTEHTKT